MRCLSTLCRNRMACLSSIMCFTTKGRPLLACKIRYRTPTLQHSICTIDMTVPTQNMNREVVGTYNTYLPGLFLREKLLHADLLCLSKVVAMSLQHQANDFARLLTLSSSRRRLATLLTPHEQMKLQPHLAQVFQRHLGRMHHTKRAGWHTAAQVM